MKNRFYSLNDYFKENFNEKIYKLSLDGGFTCPNRDGKVGKGGCIFCSENGSGDFTANKLNTITQQIDEQIKFIEKKFIGNKYIAYFQNFTNTYADIDYLEKLYYEALNHPKIFGIAIATRPDCLDEDVLKLLAKINQKFFLWAELGLQTLNDEVAKKINRGYKTEVFIEATKNLNKHNIKFVTHIILGLPCEKENDYLDTALLAEKCGTWGIKLHLLYVTKGTKLEQMFLNNELKIHTKDEYIKKIIHTLENLSYNIVIHRLTGDGDREKLVAPTWSKDKRSVLNAIHKKLKECNTYQGKLKENNNESYNR